MTTKFEGAVLRCLTNRNNLLSLLGYSLAPTRARSYCPHRNSPHRLGIVAHSRRESEGRNAREPEGQRAGEGSRSTRREGEVLRDQNFAKTSSLQMQLKMEWLLLAKTEKNTGCCCRKIL